jgi:hypothetical protein
MSYVPAGSKSDLVVLLAAAGAAVVAIEWVWRRLNPAEPDDPGDEVASLDPAGDPFASRDASEPGQSDAARFRERYERHVGRPPGESGPDATAASGARPAA